MASAKDTHRRRILAERHEQEVETAKRSCANAAERGHVQSFRDLYPEFNINSSTGYARGAMPLLPLVLLYDRNVVYVPPADKSSLETRWGLPWKDFLELVEAGVVVPMVGHLTDYVSQHFDALWSLGVESSDGRRVPPPSTWARGLTALEMVGRSESLDPKSYRINIDEVASDERLTEKYRRLFPRMSESDLHTRIRTEVLTNLADLSLFGEDDMIDALDSAGRRSSEGIASSLFMVSELRTYPELFGLGGVANYGASEMAAKFSQGDSFLPDMKPPRMLGDGYDLLLRGIGLSAENLTVREVLDFHSSSQAARLRQAIKSFEDEVHSAARSYHVTNANEIIKRAVEVDDILKSAGRTVLSPKNTRRYGRTERGTSFIVKLGGLAAGGWLGHVVGNVGYGIGGAAIIENAVIEPLKPIISDAILKMRFSPGIANLWKIKRDRSK